MMALKESCITLKISKAACVRVCESERHQYPSPAHVIHASLCIPCSAVVWGVRLNPYHFSHAPLPTGPNSGLQAFKHGAALRLLPSPAGDAAATDEVPVFVVRFYLKLRSRTMAVP